VTIERALSRRMLEHTEKLGVDDNEAGFEARIKLMEELEAQQWSDREKVLTKLIASEYWIHVMMLKDNSMFIF
jgi:hypothetical protein